MKKQIALLLLLVGGSFAASHWAFSDEEGERAGPKTAQLDVAPATLSKYAAECGACHLAYPPGLLPAQSWARLLSSLDRHFGDDASLADAERKLLLDYLTANAADRAGHRRSRKITASLAPGEAPLRITETPYIASKHREIPKRLLSGNPRVRSLSNCDACHVQAQQGIFSEHQVQIPGYGRWQD